MGEPYLSIKKFSERSGVSVPTLQRYDNEGIFVPAIRGSGSEGKHRLYDPMQLTTIKMNIMMNEIGVPLKETGELTKCRTPESITKVLRRQKGIATDHIEHYQNVDSLINTHTDLLFEGMCITETEISVTKMPEKRIIMGGENNFNESADYFSERNRFCNARHEPELDRSYPIGGYFESMDAFLKEPSQPTRFFSIDPTGHEKKAAGPYLTGYTRGYYGQTNDLPERMAAYAKKNGLVFNGPVYNIYLFNEISMVDPDQYLLQVSASVTETRRMPPHHPRRI